VEEDREGNEPRFVELHPRYGHALLDFDFLVDAEAAGGPFALVGVGCSWAGGAEGVVREVAFEEVVVEVCCCRWAGGRFGGCFRRHLDCNASIGWYML
jgi:hypothetical protein